MAVTFDIKDAKKATDVVIEVTEIVNVECFKVALTIRNKSSSSICFRKMVLFGVSVRSTFCSTSDCSSLFGTLIAFVKLDSRM